MFQTGCWHYEKGGTDLFVKTISYWLAKKGHKVVVLAHRLKEEDCSDEDICVGQGTIKVRYTPKQRKGIRFNPSLYLYRLLITSYYLCGLAKTEKIDVIVTGEPELATIITLKFLGVKIVCRGGALMYETMRKEVLKERGEDAYSLFFIGLIKLYNNLTLKLPDALVPVNDSEYEFLKIHKRKKALITTIPHGIDVNLFKLAATHKKRKKTIVGYVGRLTPIKYPEVVLEIFKEASSKATNTEFWWIGHLDPFFKESYFDDLKNKIGITNVRYFGQIANKLLPRYLNKLDIFLQAEQQKNVSRSTTEAAACGVPIVALNIGKEPYGFFTEDKNEATTELQKLITNKPYRIKQGQKARKIITEHYAEDKIYSKYLNLFESLK